MPASAARRRESRVANYQSQHRENATADYPPTIEANASRRTSVRRRIGSVVEHSAHGARGRLHLHQRRATIGPRSRPRRRCSRGWHRRWNSEGVARGRAQDRFTQL